MRTIAIASGKGGVGKSTSAVCLSEALAALGRRVLVIDLDPAASSSRWLAAPTLGLLEVFARRAPLLDLLTPTCCAGVDLIPAGTDLAAVPDLLAGRPGPDHVLRAALGALPADRWDYCLLDCPGAFGRLSYNALTAARELLAVVTPSPLALSGLAVLLDTYDTARETLNPDLELRGVLVCSADLRTRIAREAVELLRDRFGPLVLPVIRQTCKLQEAPSHQQGIRAYAPDCTAAADYEQLALTLETPNHEHDQQGPEAGQRSASTESTASPAPSCEAGQGRSDTQRLRA